MVVADGAVGQISTRLLVAGFVLLLGIVLGYVANRVNRRLLTEAGVPEAVEGTAFERTMQGLGTTTVAIIARISMWFIIGVGALAALSVADVRLTERFWATIAAFLPKVFVAVIVLIVGIVIGDKLDLLISERLRGIKLPQAGIIPRLAKLSVVYIAALIALSQIGVVTNALLILLGAYVFGLVFLGGLAIRDLLSAGAAGIYLLLNQPYGIGDEVRIGDREGVVQDVTVFVTRIEGAEVEYTIPNSRVFEEGIARSRD